MMKSILLFLFLFVSCYAIDERSSLLRGKDGSGDQVRRNLHDCAKAGKGKTPKAGKGKKGKKSSKSPINSKGKSSKSPSVKSGKGGKGSSKSPSVKSGKGGKGSSKSPSIKSSKGKSKKGKKCIEEECISPEERNTIITEITTALFGDGVFSEDQKKALQWIQSSIPSTDTTCESIFNISQKVALAVFYYAAGGSGWENSQKWLTNADECGWYGIECDGDGEIIEIKLERNNLTGYLPKELSAISSIMSLKVYDNNIGGSIPISLGSLPNLKVLDLEKNKISGALFFDEFFDLADTLVELRASSNSFKGAIPDLGDFMSLEKLWLANNTFSGDFPATITKLTGLESLKIYGNAISGALPKDIGNMAALKELDIARNIMSGNIPNSLRKLTNLEYLKVNENRLSGTIPSRFNELTKMKFFIASDNQLEGNLTSIADLNDLRYFKVDHNKLGGEIPSFPQSENPTFIDLSENQFTGTIPAALMGLPKLEYLYLNNNRLSGPIPTNWGGSKTLLDLFLGDNELEGNIPPFNGALPKITELTLNKNKLTGSVPGDICDNRKNRLDPANPLGVFENLWVDCAIKNGVAQVSCSNTNAFRCCTTCTEGKGA